MREKHFGLSAAQCQVQELFVKVSDLGWRLCIALGLGGLASAALAQSTVPQTTDLGRVEIRSNRDNDTEVRRESTAAKIVIGREEIEKQGDATISEVLKRLPGVTIGGGARAWRGHPHAWPGQRVHPNSVGRRAHAAGFFG